MSQIIFQIDRLPPVIDIGKQTEKGVTRVGFDVHEWLDDWPGMRFSVQPTRPGETETYTAATDMVGSVIFWLVGAVDTEKPGSGTVEVLGVTEDERKLSFMCRTAIANTNTVTTAEIQEPNRPWVDQVIMAGETAKADAKDAAQSAQEAVQAASDAGQYSDNADKQAASAAQSAVYAGESKLAAAQSAEAAEKAKQTAIAQADDAEAAAKEAKQYRFDAAADASKAEVSATNAQAFYEDAKEKANAASASANEASASSNAAKTSATAAASSERTAISQANNAATSATVASQNASVASSRAKEAATSATAAKTSESNAKTSETAASAFAIAAGASATAAEASAKKAGEIAEHLFIVTVKTDVSTGKNIPDKTVAEVLAAKEAGMACLLVDGIMGHVYTYVCKEAGNPKFTFIQNTEDEAFPGLWLNEATMLADGTVRFSVYTPITTPNPRTLTITGAVEAEYNGSENVTVEIPIGGGAGLPETADPLKQLVTDADGKVAWEERLAYKTTAKVENLAETVLENIDDNGDDTLDNIALITVPWAADLTAGSMAMIAYNGTNYECKAVDYKAILPDMPEGVCALGNISTLGFEGIEGSNEDAPFALVTQPSALAVEQGGIYGVLMIGDGAASVTLAVSSIGTVYKTIAPEYLPKNIVNEAPMIVTIDITTLTIDHPYADVYAALFAGKHVQIRAGADGRYNALTLICYDADFIGVLSVAWDDHGYNANTTALYRINSDGTVNVAG